MLHPYAKINYLKDYPEKWNAPKLNFKCHSKESEYLTYINVIFK